MTSISSIPIPINNSIDFICSDLSLTNNGKKEFLARNKVTDPLPLARLIYMPGSGRGQPAINL
jgi:hypothetical protein